MSQHSKDFLQRMPIAKEIMPRINKQAMQKFLNFFMRKVTIAKAGKSLISNYMKDLKINTKISN